MGNVCLYALRIQKVYVHFCYMVCRLKQTFIFPFFFFWKTDLWWLSVSYSISPVHPLCSDHGVSSLADWVSAYPLCRFWCSKWPVKALDLASWWVSYVPLAYYYFSVPCYGWYDIIPCCMHLLKYSWWNITSNDWFCIRKIAKAALSFFFFW